MIENPVEGKIIRWYSGNDARTEPCTIVSVSDRQIKIQRNLGGVETYNRRNGRKWGRADKYWSPYISD